MPTNKVKVGRNDLCQCGSGKKQKKCCGNPTARATTSQSHSLPQPFTVKEVTPTQVPPEVIQKARRYFVEKQQEEQERISRFGLVPPVISADFNGYKLVAIRNKLFYKPVAKCKFFTDVLIDYVPTLFGREWFEHEIAKHPDERHPVMQWRVKGMSFMNAQPPLPDGTYEATPTGPLLAYMTFAYDLYVVEHNAGLDARLLERLKRADQFQGARHELFAEATCLRAGFEIEHEDETDCSTRHVEFTATHKSTGQKISVEAKSKHRPGVLGQTGARQPDNALDLPFGKLLNDAVAKNAPHPLVVFLDMNMPFQAAQRFLGRRPPQTPHPFIVKTLQRMRKSNGGKDPINLLVMTNHPQHYTKDEEIACSGHLLTAMNGFPLKAVHRPDALFALHQAANLYGNIPQELSTNFGH
jgi:hypothetical protein